MAALKSAGTVHKLLPPRTLFPATLFVLLSGSAVFFAGSVAAPQILARTGGGEVAGGLLTAAVQLGFVVGTFVTVLLDLPDRLPARRLLAALLLGAAGANALLLTADSVWEAGLWRFLGGALAGPVYPIGMRLLATWYDRLGTRLGVLLAGYTFGAGTAAMLRVAQVPFEQSVLGASVLAVVAAVVAGWMGAGPRLPSRQAFDVKALARAYRVPQYRWSSFGYFGHMWELFAFWGLVPFWLAATEMGAGASQVALAGIYGAGALGCLWAAHRSPRVGAARVAHTALIGSGLLALASPWLFAAPPAVAAAGLAVWGFLVIADSPMFSALSAEAAPRAYVGSALTIQNSIGFAIPIVPLSMVPWIAGHVGWQWAFPLLALGPLFGVVFTARLASERQPTASPVAG